MGRPKQKLNDRYGKLTVIGEDEGRVEAICDCGRTLSVARSNLRSGKTRSCGRPGCRDRTPSPLTSLIIGPSWLSPKADIRALFEDYSNGKSAAYCAAQYGTAEASVDSVYNLIRAIKKKGGINEYMKALRTPAAPQDNAAVTSTIQSVEPAPTPVAVGAPPPSVFGPK